MPKALQSTTTPARRPDGTLLPGHHGPHHVGQGGYEVGRIKDLSRTRRELNLNTIKALQKAFDRGGDKAINKVMRNNPAMFLKMLVLLVPREMEVSHSAGVKGMTTEQIEQAIEVVKDLIAKRDAGQSAKVIEGTSSNISGNPNKPKVGRPKGAKRSKNLADRIARYASPVLPQTDSIDDDINKINELSD